MYSVVALLSVAIPTFTVVLLSELLTGTSFPLQPHSADISQPHYYTFPTLTSLLIDLAITH